MKVSLANPQSRVLEAQRWPRPWDDQYSGEGPFLSNSCLAHPSSVCFVNVTERDGRVLFFFECYASRILFCFSLPEWNTYWGPECGILICMSQGSSVWIFFWCSNIVIWVYLNIYLQETNICRHDISFLVFTLLYLRLKTLYFEDNIAEAWIYYVTCVRCNDLIELVSPSYFRNDP